MTDSPGPAKHQAIQHVLHVSGNHVVYRPAEGAGSIGNQPTGAFGWAVNERERSRGVILVRPLRFTSTTDIQSDARADSTDWMSVVQIADRPLQHVHELRSAGTGETSVRWREFPFA